MPDVAKLQTPDGKHIDLPVLVGTEDERGLDISKLLGSTGYVTLDEGFVNTGSTTSAITFLDGDRGILRYRGYPIEQLASRCSFTEVCYLLLNGELPTSSELEQFADLLKRHTMLHEDL
jgi:citrate synthase